MKEVMRMVEEVQWKMEQAILANALILEQMEGEAVLLPSDDEGLRAHFLLRRMPLFLAALNLVDARLQEVKEQIDKAVELGFAQERAKP